MKGTENADIASIFFSIADIWEIKGDKWRPISYRKAARNIESLAENVRDTYNKGGIDALEEIPGVGEAIAGKIEEFLKTGHMKHYDKIKKDMPQGLDEIIDVPGVGPKTAYLLYKKLKLKGLKDLEKAAKEHRISALPGFKAKSEENILKAIELVKKGQKRMLLGDALPIARMFVERLKKVKGVRKISYQGSLRRMRETIGDIDILVSAKDSGPVSDAFTTMPEVIQVLAKGPTKSMVRAEIGGRVFQCDLRVIEDKTYGAGQQYFTGDQQHNIEMRRIAIKKGLKLSEYGVVDKKGKLVAGKTEEEVYKSLGVAWIPPELRQNTGEIEAAIKGKLPKLVELKDIKGDMHMHTTWTDGSHSIKEMVAASKAMGYEYITITDHSKSTTIAGGLNEKKLLQYIKAVKKVGKETKGMKVFVGSEVDIKTNGELDYSDEYLKKLDIVNASIHSRFKSTKKEMTDRILSAFTNKHLKLFCHPTGRLIHQRNPYDVDLEKIFEEAAQRKIALEVDSIPDRLDLRDQHVRRAIEMGVKIMINSDAHHRDQLNFMEFGVATARRGWAEKKDILNTYSLAKLSKYWNLKN